MLQKSVQTGTRAYALGRQMLRSAVSEHASASRQASVANASTASLSVVGRQLSSKPSGDNLSSKTSILRHNVLRKVKRGTDRLPSQGPDPAITARTPNGWRIATAAVVERHPVVIPEPHPFEGEYLRGRFDWQQMVAKPIPEHWFKVQDGQEDELAKNEALAAMYNPAPIYTEADRTNNQRSLNRALRERLYFLVKRSPKATFYQFPQSILPIESDDQQQGPRITLRVHAERAFRAVLPIVGPDDPEVPVPYFVSNAPACHLAHKYSDAFQEKTGYYGVKIFYYRAEYLRGHLDDTKPLPSGADFVWARESELPELLSAETFEAVKPILVSVTPRNVEFKQEYPKQQDGAVSVTSS